MTRSQRLSALLGAAVLLLFYAATAPADDVYKCGRTYADFPCGPEAVKLPKPASQPATLRSLSIRLGTPEQEAIDRLRADGLHYRVNVLESDDGTTKQIVVGRHVQTQWYIFTRNGVVSSLLW
jgi:hypothetical protein